MIKKEVMKSIKLLQHEALLRRLPDTHPQYERIKKAYRSYAYGHKGEKALGHVIERGMLDESGIILYDIRMQIKEKDYFQMDALLITSKFLLIMDSKYLAGELYFDETFHQLVQRTNGKSTKYADPILQVKQHAEHLQRWLIANHFPLLPIETLVVITHPKAIITTSPNYHEAVRMVSNLEALSLKIKAILDKNLATLSSEKKNKKLARTLYKQNIPLHTDILNIYKLEKSSIQKGAICPQCFSVPMVRDYGKWLCPVCKHTSTTAHYNALTDYFLLINSSITNKEFKSMLNISSSNIAKKILSKSGLKHTGETKGKKYFFTYNDLEKYAQFMNVYSGLKRF